MWAEGDGWNDDNSISNTGIAATTTTTTTTTTTATSSIVIGLATTAIIYSKESKAIDR